MEIHPEIENKFYFFEGIPIQPPHPPHLLHPNGPNLFLWNIFLEDNFDLFLKLVDLFVILLHQPHNIHSSVLFGGFTTNNYQQLSTINTTFCEQLCFTNVTSFRYFITLHIWSHKKSLAIQVSTHFCVLDSLFMNDFQTTKIGLSKFWKK
jgi:hypothetical protein